MPGNQELLVSSQTGGVEHTLLLKEQRGCWWAQALTMGLAHVFIQHCSNPFPSLHIPSCELWAREGTEVDQNTSPGKQLCKNVVAALKSPPKAHISLPRWLAFFHFISPLLIWQFVVTQWLCAHWFKSKLSKEMQRKDYRRGIILQSISPS